jgi:hypothetical protein
VQTDPGNNLRGAPPTVLHGRGELTLTVADVSVTVGPLGFLQPNPAAAALAYQDLLHDEHGAPLSGALALDLYAGAGITTELLRRNFNNVEPCESYPESAASLGVAPETAEAFLQRPHVTPDLVLANPPREGLGPDVCAALVRLAAPRVHIMSCGPAGLARDLAALAPGYRLAGLRAYDTLPHTPHIELVAWLKPRPVLKTRSTYLSRRTPSTHPASIRPTSPGSPRRSSTIQRAPARSSSSREPDPCSTPIVGIPCAAAPTTSCSRSPTITSPCAPPSNRAARATTSALPTRSSASDRPQIPSSTNNPATPSAARIGRAYTSGLSVATVSGQPLANSANTSRSPAAGSVSCVHVRA